MRHLQVQPCLCAFPFRCVQRSRIAFNPCWTDVLFFNFTMENVSVKFLSAFGVKCKHCTHKAVIYTCYFFDFCRLQRAIQHRKRSQRHPILIFRE